MAESTQPGRKDIVILKSGEELNLSFSPRELATMRLLLSPGRITKERIKEKIREGMGIIYPPQTTTNSEPSNQSYT